MTNEEIETKRYIYDKSIKEQNYYRQLYYSTLQSLIQTKKVLTESFLQLGRYVAINIGKVSFQKETYNSYLYISQMHKKELEKLERLTEFYNGRYDYYTKLISELKRELCLL